MMKDDNIFEILMTSEFSEGYRKEDFIFFLNKFRAFYRILHGRMTHLSSDIETKDKEFESEINRLRSEINDLKIENANLQNSLDLSKVRKKGFWSKVGF